MYPMLFFINLHFFWIYGSKKHQKRKNDLESAIYSEVNTFPGHSQIAQEEKAEIQVESKLSYGQSQINKLENKQFEMARMYPRCCYESTGLSSSQKMCFRPENIAFEKKQNSCFEGILGKQTQSVRHFQQNKIRNEEKRVESSAFGESSSESLFFHTDTKDGDIKCSSTEAICQNERKEAGRKEARWLNNSEKAAHNTPENPCEPNH